MNAGTCDGTGETTGQCELVCRCSPQFKGERCEEGANYVNVILKPGNVLGLLEIIEQ